MLWFRFYLVHKACADLNTRRTDFIKPTDYLDLKWLTARIKTELQQQ